MGFFLLFSHKYHPILWEVRTVKNILTIIMSIVLVLMLAIDIFFYQRPEGRMFMLTGGMEEYVSLSEFYDEIVAIGGDLPHTCTSDDLGWNLNRDGQIEIDMPAGKMSNGEPCLVLDYHVAPRYDYSKLS